MNRRYALGLAAALVVAACGPATTPRPRVEATGPPEIEADLVARHAEQFDQKLAGRVAGSQQEQVSAVYINGHLQQAGYVILLDPVPVADTVRSTNVIARPPSGRDPVVVVVVPYDVPPGAEDEVAYGTAIGTFLEAARAHRVAEPEHSVQFVALGAEFTAEAGGLLGSRRLVRDLVDDGLAPTIVELAPLQDGAPLEAGGSAAAGLDAAAGVAPPSARVYEAAGLDYVFIGGDPAAAGDALLGYLAERGN